MKGDLTGGCLCGEVRYTLHQGFRLNPYACHCTDCLLLARVAGSNVRSTGNVRAFDWEQHGS